MTELTGLEHARAVADAVLYEGYLLYPYRATSRKNQVRWQFGVLGPPGAAETGVGEGSTMSVDYLVRAGRPSSLEIHVRCLQLQTRSAQVAAPGGYRPVDELAVGDRRWLTWDEAAVAEQIVGPLSLADVAGGLSQAVVFPAGQDIEEIADEVGAPAGRLVRDRHELSAELTLESSDVDGLTRVSMRLDNLADSVADKDSAIATSFIGTHVLVEVIGGEFVSTVNPPADALIAAAQCKQNRWWPVLAGPAEVSTILLVTPIIVEDHAELAPQSAGALFDSTEIDEILTLRVMTMTDAEKADARATDPRAAEIIDRCDSLTPEQLQEMHGVLRNPHGSPTATAGDPFALPDDFAWATPAMDDTHPIFTSDAPWWDPEADASVAPDTDSVTIDGVRISRGCLVTVRPSRRADAQDMFFAGMTARVTAVLSDVDGDTHVAVTLVDDPASEMHDWYGRYHYFAPDELEPIPADAAPPGPPQSPPQGETS